MTAALLGERRISNLAANPESRIKCAFAALIVAQIAHSAEEYSVLRVVEAIVTRDQSTSTSKEIPRAWSIRAAEPSEAQQIATFGAMLFRQAYEATHPEPTLSEYLADSFAIPRIARTLEDSASTIFVIVSNTGSWIGYAELHQGPPTAVTTVLTRALPGDAPMEIVRFYVDQAWHGRGVAQDLMYACEEHARMSGCDSLWLQAWQQATQAVRFYRKAGFDIYGSAVFIFGARADRDFVLARALTPSSSK